MGNTNNNKDPPFEKIPVKRRILTAEEISVHIKDSSEKVSEFFKKITDKGYKKIKKFTKSPDERSGLTKSIIFNSIFSTVLYMIIQARIVDEYVDEDIYGLMCAFLCATCLFTLLNFCFICPSECLFGKPACLVGKPETRLILYFIALCGYLGLFCPVAHFLRKNDYVSFIISLIVFFGSVNAHGIIVIFISVVYLIYGIVYWCNKFILYLSLNCCCNSKEDSHYTIYLYDPSKTEEKICTICFEEYKKLDEIRICKAHPIHIFHEKCISESLLRRPICPLCAGNEPAKFH